MSNVIDLFSAFSTDATKEQEGTLTSLPECGDTKWRIARAGNKNYNRVLSSLYKRNRAALEAKGDEAEAKSNELLADVYAKTILLGWEGTIMFKGKKEAYSQEVAKQLLLLKDFRAKVEAVSQDFATFKSVQDEEDLGN
jgi:hypothetical protein